MSSAGGGSGIGGGRVPNQGVQIPPSEEASAGATDVSGGSSGGIVKPEGVAGEMSVEQLEALEKAKGGVEGEGGVDGEVAVEGRTAVRGEGAVKAGDVPSDTFGLKKELGVVGPKSTSEGMQDIDAELSELVFEANGVASPYNANTTPALYESIKGTPEFETAVTSLTGYLQNPTAANQHEFAQYMKALEAQHPHGNIMEVLFLVFRESIKETNEDKKYFLMKLQEFNKMGEALSEYLSELVEASRDLGANAAGAKYPEMEMTSEAVEVKQYDLTTLNNKGELQTTSVDPRRLDQQGLSATIKEVESMQETVRNKRQMASTAFQNFDQKANQLYNLLSSVMKSMNEMRGGTVRNML